MILSLSRDAEYTELDNRISLVTLDPQGIQGVCNETLVLTHVYRLVNRWGDFSPVFLKVGGIAPLGEILNGKGAKK